MQVVPKAREVPRVQAVPKARAAPKARAVPRVRAVRKARAVANAQAVPKARVVPEVREVRKAQAARARSQDGAMKSGRPVRGVRMPDAARGIVTIGVLVRARASPRKASRHQTPRTVGVRGSDGKHLARLGRLGARVRCAELLAKPARGVLDALRRMPMSRVVQLAGSRALPARNVDRVVVRRAVVFPGVARPVDSVAQTKRARAKDSAAARREAGGPCGVRRLIRLECAPAFASTESGGPVTKDR